MKLHKFLITRFLGGRQSHGGHSRGGGGGHTVDLGRLNGEEDENKGSNSFSLSRKNYLF